MGIRLYRSIWRRSVSHTVRVYQTLYWPFTRRGQFGQDLFTLRSTFFQGRRPKSVNLHWRRFATKDIPLDDPKAFEQWLLQRWREKDDLLEYYLEHNRFPADKGAQINGGKNGYIETEVKTANPLEFMQIFVPSAALALVINVIVKFLRMVLSIFRLRWFPLYKLRKHFKEFFRGF